jgi:hypothetical protein
VSFQRQRAHNIINLMFICKPKQVYPPDLCGSILGVLAKENSQNASCVS